MFPVVIQSDIDNDGLMLSNWLEDLDERLNNIQMIKECNPIFGEKLQFAMDRLCNEVLQHCFDFLENSSAIGLFKSDEDAVRYTDSFFIDSIVGTYIRFFDLFEKQFEKWEFDTKHILPKLDDAKGAPKARKLRPNIPKEARDILSAWFRENATNPYPKLQEKERLSIQTGLSLKKVENWFINERSRKWHLYNKNIKSR